MKFIIHRTSKPWGSCPCEEAKYDEDYNCWTIEINSIDELIELCYKYGKLFIDSGWNESCHYIEICDTL